MAEVVGYGLWTSLNLPQPLEVAGPRQVGGLLTQLPALLGPATERRSRRDGGLLSHPRPVALARTARARCLFAQSERNPILTYNKVYAQ